METTIIAVIESLDSKPKEFRDQVNAFRDFKNKMRDAGVVPEEEQFALPSLRRLETLPEQLAAEEQASRIRAEALRAEVEKLRAALEEAAKLADAKADEWATVWRNRMKADSHMEGQSDGADEIAAAIRALISRENSND